MNPRVGRFGPSDRLLNARDFARVAAEGRRRASREFVVLMASNDNAPRLRVAGRNRLGVTTSRRVGNSVVRNRVKRAVRSWFQRARVDLGEGIVVVVIAKPPAGRMTRCEIHQQLMRQTRCGESQ